MATFSELRQATLDARERKQDAAIGVQVHQGLYDVVRAIPPASGRGAYTIDCLSAGLTADGAVKFLEAMQ